MKAPEWAEKVPDGSWFGSMKVESDIIWKQIQSGEFRGFSVEGLFAQDREFELPEKVINKIKEVIKKYKISQKVK